jgi:phage FluMu protein Com
MQSRENQTRAPAERESSLRCGCGNLLARMVAGGVEIKCRRCKRYVILPFAARETARLNL